MDPDETPNWHLILVQTVCIQYVTKAVCDGLGDCFYFLFFAFSDFGKKNLGQEEEQKNQKLVATSSFQFLYLKKNCITVTLIGMELLYLP